MIWLFIAIASYALLAVAALIDKFLLSGGLSNPKLYAFYVGALTAPALFLLLFGYWGNPTLEIFLIGFAAGVAQIYGCYSYLSALKHLEATRAVSVIGSLVPILAFFLTALVSGGMAVLGSKELVGFILLIMGSWLIMAQGVSIKNDGLGFIFQASLLYALSVVLMKLVYLQMPFLSGFLLLAVGSVAAALTFLVSRDVRRTVLGHHSIKEMARPNFLFFIGQTMGGAAFFLQSLAISKAPQASVPIINAMAGVQYAFLFVFSIIISFYFPKLLKEKITRANILQKTLAIILIVAGLAVFTLNS